MSGSRTPISCTLYRGEAANLERELRPLPLGLLDMKHYFQFR